MQGPQIFFTIPLFGGIKITETTVNTWIIMLIIVLLCKFLTTGLKVIPTTKRQVIAEKLVTMVENMVDGNMGHGRGKGNFAPYIAALFSLSILGSASSLLGMRPYTADINTTLGWAIMTFFMVQYTGLRYKGVKGYIKGFAEPVPFILPLNIISEFSNPLSMAFRHFGNIAGGMVITSLLYSALAALSGVILQFIPNAIIQSIPIFQVGIPAFLSIYFDLFTSFLQAYIFCLLTMVFVSSNMDD